MDRTKTRTVMIRNLDLDAWIALRARAVRERRLTGVILSGIIREWMEAQSAAREEEVSAGT